MGSAVGDMCINHSSFPSLSSFRNVIEFSNNNSCCFLTETVCTVIPTIVWLLYYSSSVVHFA